MEWAFKQTNIGSVLILLIALDAGSHSQKSRETDFRLHATEGIGRMQESRLGQMTSLYYTRAAEMMNLSKGTVRVETSA